MQEIIVFLITKNHITVTIDLPRGGLEPPCLAALDFESSMSTIPSSGHLSIQVVS